MKLSVIIPTYKRTVSFLSILKKNLRLFKKHLDILEIIIVDDNENNFLYKNNLLFFKKESLLHYFNNGHSGSTSARNLGIKKAKGGVILFIDDDILLTNEAIKRHIRFHKNNFQSNKCLVGYTIMPSEIEKYDDLNKWISNNNIQFGDISYDNNIDYRFFYTCNLSIKRKFLIDNGSFDKEFSAAVYDDIELGFRLKKKGLQIFFDKKCITYHIKKYDLRTLTKRYYLMGVYAVKLIKKHPSLKGSFIKIKPTFKENILISLNKVFGYLARFNINTLSFFWYKSTVIKYFFNGIKDGYSMHSSL